MALILMTVMPTSLSPPVGHDLLFAARHPLPQPFPCCHTKGHRTPTDTDPTVRALRGGSATRQGCQRPGGPPLEPPPHDGNATRIGGWKFVLIRPIHRRPRPIPLPSPPPNRQHICLLYTSDAADEEDSVDLGGRRIIKK